MATLCAGIIGLPNAGKSTLFNLLTSGNAQIANFPFSTVSPNIGVVIVPDSRLDRLSELLHPGITTPATVQFVDVAGLVKGAHQGEGLGNEFLSRIRVTDVLVEVVRCFREEKIAHFEGDVDPVRDVQIIKLELILSDLEIVERKLTKLNKLIISKFNKNKERFDLLQKAKLNLDKGNSLREVSFSKEKERLLSKEGFLSFKPLIYMVNVNEDDLASPSPLLERLREYTSAEGLEVIEICAKLELELEDLSEEEKMEFIKELRIRERGIDRLIKGVYERLNLITFFTVSGGKEVRAWPIRRGITASQAAGRVHSDMERGFIRSETIAVSDLLRIGSMKQAKEEGEVRVEGKDYSIKDGDVMHFRFSN